MLINDINYTYYQDHKNYHSKILAADHPENSLRTTDEWYNYPIQDFDYQFNSWGFRGPEYNEHVGQPVNICLGDSFTVNLGGPVEHSWCSQLAEHFDIPTLNLGMDGAGNDAIQLVYKRACELFDVQNTFVMYSFLHRRLVDGEFKHHTYTSYEEDLEYFSEHRITDVIEAALPNRFYGTNEKNLLNSLEIYMFDTPVQYYIDCKNTVDQNRQLYTHKEAYNSLRGKDWPTFAQFVKGANHHPDMLTKEFGNFFYNHLFASNRDGIHLNKETNKLYADYFYRQWKQKNES